MHTKDYYNVLVTSHILNLLLLAVPTYYMMLRESYNMIVMKLLRNPAMISTMDLQNSSINTY